MQGKCFVESKNEQNVNKLMLSDETQHELNSVKNSKSEV